MTPNEIIEMALKAGFVEYEIDDGTTNAFDKRYAVFAKLVAAKYEVALVDYIKHVGYCEGTDFISDIDWVENKTSVEIIKAAAIRARGQQ
jgi:hypothetical protein